MGSGAAWSKRWRDDLLGQAVRALREQADADAPDAIESWQAMDAWRDVSGDLRRANRRRRIKLIGAWAAVSGRLPPLFSRAVRAIRPPAAPSRAAAHLARARREPPVEDPPAMPPAAAVEEASDPAPPRRRWPVKPLPVAAPAVAASGPAGAPVAPASDDIYARAHHAQFAAHDYAAALTLAG